MRYFTTAALLLTLVAGITGAWITGWYPVALVRSSPALGEKSHIMWARAVEKVARATITYYHAIGAIPGTPSEQKTIATETRAQALTILIEQTLVADAVRRHATNEDIAARIDTRISSRASQQELYTAISLVYGLDASGFYTLIARPEAEKELLKETLNLDDAGFSAWLAAEKKAAMIILFIAR